MSVPARLRRMGCDANLRGYDMVEQRVCQVCGVDFQCEVACGGGWRMQRPVFLEP